MCGLERRDAPTTVTLCDVDLHALACAVPQVLRGCVRTFDPRELNRRRTGESHHGETDAEAPFAVAADGAVCLESKEQSVGGGTWEFRRGHDLDQVLRFFDKGRLSLVE